MRPAAGFVLAVFALTTTATAAETSRYTIEQAISVARSNNVDR